MDNVNTESATKHRFILTVVGLYLLGVGFLSGMMIDHIRFDESRSNLLARLEQDSHTLHERLMAIEREESW
jgi:hypothetical protein